MVGSTLDPPVWSSRSGGQSDSFAALVPVPSVPPAAIAASAIEHGLLTLVAFAESICTFGPRVRRKRKEELLWELRVEREIEYEYELKNQSLPPETAAPHLVPVAEQHASPADDEFNRALVAGALGLSVADVAEQPIPARTRTRNRRRRERPSSIQSIA